MKANRIPIPRAALDQHVIVLGKTGSAKSSKLRYLIEPIIEAGDIPGCIVDKKGDWYGLKWARDGKKPGLDVVIFGGPHADVPISPNAGAEIGELVSTSGRWCIIDMKGWMPTQCHRFFVAFASTLYAKNQGKRFLLIDECHNFCPKGRMLDIDQAKCLHWANTLAAEGRGLGITLLAASQRPQKVHNDFLTSCETLIACKVIHKADRDAYADWMEGAGDKEASRLVLNQVAEMPRTDAFVWSPEIGFGPKRVSWPMFETFDSFAPRAAKAVKLKAWSPQDLAKIREQLAGVVQQAEENDPVVLRERLVKLRKEIDAKKPAAAVVNNVTTNAKPAQIEAAFQRGVKSATRTLNAEYKMALDRIGATINKGSSNLMVEAARFGDSIHAFDLTMQKILRTEYQVARAAGPPSLKDAPVTQPQIAARVIEPVKSKPLPAATVTIKPVDYTGSELGAGHRKMLNVIAQHPSQGVSKGRLGFLAGYSHVSGTFDNLIGRLRGLGLVGKGWPVQPTTAGLDAAGPLDPLPTGEAARAGVLERLSAGHRKMAAYLFDIYPRSASKEDLSEGTGYAHTSGTFDNLVGRLRSIEVATKGWPIKANDEFFE